jgi:protein arginine kinase
MNLDALVPALGEWLRGTGPDSDIILSTRIRLARNLADIPFTNRADNAQKAAVIRRVREALGKIRLPYTLEYHELSTMSPLDRQLLVERQLISPELAAHQGPCGVAFDERESVSIMVNEEDHLRLQVLRSGLDLEEAWEQINQLDDSLEAYLPFAFHPQFGYLTACPTNVGTGLRASVMLHLPALNLTRQLERTLRAIQKIQLTVRGLHGERSHALGDLYQISNQVTLGKPEQRILQELREVIRLILDGERQARQLLLQEQRQVEQNRVARALGALGSATLITTEETLELLSVVRLGIHLKLVDNIPTTVVNQLFIQCQSAHLQKIVGHALDGEERNVARARFLKERLRQLGPQLS